jgi:hypothetical protein
MCHLLCGRVKAFTEIKNKNKKKKKKCTVFIVPQRKTSVLTQLHSTVSLPTFNIYLRNQVRHCLITMNNFFLTSFPSTFIINHHQFELLSQTIPNSDKKPKLLRAEYALDYSQKYSHTSQKTQPIFFTITELILRQK